MHYSPSHSASTGCRGASNGGDNDDEGRKSRVSHHNRRPGAMPRLLYHGGGDAAKAKCRFARAICTACQVSANCGSLSG